MQQIFILTLFESTSKEAPPERTANVPINSVQSRNLTIITSHSAQESASFILKYETTQNKKLDCKMNLINLNFSISFEIDEEFLNIKC